MSFKVGQNSSVTRVNGPSAFAGRLWNSPIDNEINSKLNTGGVLTWDSIVQNWTLGPLVQGPTGPIGPTGEGGSSNKVAEFVEDDVAVTLGDLSFKWDSVSLNRWVWTSSISYPDGLTWLSIDPNNFDKVYDLPFPLILNSFQRISFATNTSSTHIQLNVNSINPQKSWRITANHETNFSPPNFICIEQLYP